MAAIHESTQEGAAAPPDDRRAPLPPLSSAAGTGEGGDGGGAWDEMRARDGSVRPHWRQLDESLRAFGPGEMWRRWEQARQLIRQHGVTFNVYGDPRGLERPWPLDPIPVVVSPEEFATLSAGLAQRAMLLDRLLVDLYDQRRTLSEGLIPPELILGQPGLLRACAGLTPPVGRFLFLYAADLARTPDGVIRVLADRTQAPAGAGYALENRIVLGRVLPEAFRDINAHRLARFFQTLRDTLTALAPHGVSNPRIVLLTAGPHNATYFEQAFLAQYLGYPLVEGGDLMVRDGRVFLKTLGGLHPVDVILRRLRDDFCDPLELRADSLLGVPGLVQAARDGAVAIANAIGTGVLQTPALIPFLPAVCRVLLGEELKLPAVETWWCGDPVACEHVIAHLREMVIKPAFPLGPTDPIFGGRLDQAALQALTDRIRATPGQFVGQRHATPSRVPVIDGDSLRPGPVVLRSFVVADPGGGYQTMPGALGLVAGVDEADISIARGARSKDTWVISDAAVSDFSLLRPSVEPVELTRGGGDLPSRVADNFFWLGRYAERAEAVARLGRIICSRLAEPRDPRSAPGHLAPLAAALQAQTMVASGADLRSLPPVAERAAAERVMREALFGTGHLGTLLSSGRAIDRVARALRDRLSQDTWTVLSALAQELADAEGQPGQDRQGERQMERPIVVGARLDRMVMALAGLSGLTSESMTREVPWRFMDMGRRLERALNTALMLERTLAATTDDELPLLEALLEAADSAMTYRRRYRATLQVAPVVDLLLADERNPRAIVFQLAALADHVASLPRDSSAARRRPEERIAFEALSEMRLVDVEALCTRVDDGRPALGALLADLVGKLQALSDAVFLAYLQTPAKVSRASAHPDISG
ncbi:MAG TPA: circularly permuted type 2 ATP-grasp protein [Polyangia bacterium]|nr:circularly permuted type 2 ATP-grasp protein [Polyangia bacterium]